ncbi:hypothetical protein [Breoghania sp.]|uniref:hypothetical protein n=1 Tax=Breoghania sp. TaxID=2065378 RepID=UPI00261E03D2|nr:hypothetical protein [Breoghania sp.]MDJ0933418.1 hypothetical protein [Breoghania sp.]
MAVTISDGSVSATDDGIATYINGANGAATVDVTGGTVEVTGTNTVAIRNRVGNATSTGTVTISGGSVAASGNYSKGIVSYLGSDEGTSTVTISGGTVTADGNRAYAIEVYQIAGETGGSTTVTLSGGTVQATGTDARAVDFDTRDGSTNSLTIGTAATVIGDLFAQTNNTSTTDLTFNGTGSGTFSADIEGFASITKTDTGTWTLSGNITNSGDFTVAAGTLNFGGVTTSLVNVQSGAVLTGSGTTGDLTFDAGSTYLVDLSSSEFLDSTGAATIDADTALEVVAGDAIAQDLDTPFAVLTHRHQCQQRVRHGGGGFRLPRRGANLGCQHHLRDADPGRRFRRCRSNSEPEDGGGDCGEPGSR